MTTIGDLTHARPDGTSETTPITDTTGTTLTVTGPGVHRLTAHLTGQGRVILHRRPAPAPLTPRDTPDEYWPPSEYGLYLARLEWRDGDTVTPLTDQAGATVQPGEVGWNDDFTAYVIPSLGPGGPWVVYEPMTGGPK